MLWVPQIVHLFHLMCVSGICRPNTLYNREMWGSPKRENSPNQADFVQNEPAGQKLVESTLRHLQILCIFQVSPLSTFKNAGGGGGGVGTGTTKRANYERKKFSKWDYI